MNRSFLWITLWETRASACAAPVRPGFPLGEACQNEALFSLTKQGLGTYARALHGVLSSRISLCTASPFFGDKSAALAQKLVQSGGTIRPILC